VVPTPPDPAADRRRLIEILLRRSLRFGQFTLSSGQTSSYYIDVRRTSLDAEGAWLIGRLVWARYADDIAAGRITAVGGLTLGADPVVMAALLEARAQGHALDAFLVRKAAKGHGALNLIEGNLVSGTRALVVEDVCTGGESALQAARAARASGAIVERAWCVVDRKAGGADALAAEGIELSSCLDVRTLLEAAPEGLSRLDPAAPSHP
jgi:orotate phosphoribosyltransferase